jgi:hypothetical protein
MDIVLRLGGLLADRIQNKKECRNQGRSRQGVSWNNTWPDAPLRERGFKCCLHDWNSPTAHLAVFGEAVT